MALSPAGWRKLLKRLEKQQKIQTVSDLRKIRKRVDALKMEIASSLVNWEALAAHGDRTGMMMVKQLKGLEDHLSWLLDDTVADITGGLSNSWQRWWWLGSQSTQEVAAAAGMARTELALASNKLDLYEHYIPTLIKSVGDSTKLKVAKVIRTAALAGESRVAVQKKILSALVGEPMRHAKRFGGFSYQVERIFRTESQRLYNMASHEAAVELNERSGTDLVKVWNHSGADATARDDHVAMDGEIAELNEPFSNGLMYPKDPAGAAEDTVNCRCYMTHIPRDVAGES